MLVDFKAEVCETNKGQALKSQWANCCLSPQICLVFGSNVQKCDLKIHVINAQNYFTVRTKSVTIIFRVIFQGTAHRFSI